MNEQIVWNSCADSRNLYTKLHLVFLQWLRYFATGRMWERSFHCHIVVFICDRKMETDPTSVRTHINIYCTSLLIVNWTLS